MGRARPFSPHGGDDREVLSSVGGALTTFERKSLRGGSKTDLTAGRGWEHFGGGPSRVPWKPLFFFLIERGKS